VGGKGTRDSGQAMGCKLQKERQGVGERVSVYARFGVKAHIRATDGLCRITKAEKKPRLVEQTNDEGEMEERNHGIG